MPEHNNLLDSDWAAQFSDVPGAAIARQPESDAGEIQYDDLPESDLLDSDWAAQFAEPTEQTAYHRAGQTAAEWRSLWDPTGDWLSSLDEGEAERGLIPGFYGSTARGMGQMVGDIASAVEATGGPGGVGAGTADFFEGFLSDPSLRRSESVDRPEGEWDWMTNWRWWNERGTETASQFIVQLAAAVVTKNPGMMIAPQMLQEAGGTYKEEQRRHLRDGLSVEEAHERAATTAALTKNPGMLIAPQMLQEAGGT